MAWIESHQQLARHPKCLRLAARLKINKAQAIGHLHLLWWWTLDYASNGDLSAFTSCEIGAAAEWTGDADGFRHALLVSGWLDEDNKIHDWRDYAGRMLEMRAGNRERQRRYRERNGDVTVTSPLHNGLPNPTQPNHKGTPTAREGPDEPDDLLTAAQGVSQADNAGVPKDFAQWVFDDWHSRGGRDAGNVQVPWARYVKKRWNREQQEWQLGTHHGKQKAGNNEKNRKSGGANRTAHLGTNANGINQY